MEMLTIYRHPEIGEVRTIDRNGEPWFVGKDVAERLAYSNTRKAISDHVDEEDRDGVTIRDAIGRPQQIIIINESGLYSLILRSQLPQAREFKRWVTQEVLPSIRRTGAYRAAAVPDLTPEQIFRAAEMVANCPPANMPHVLRILGNIIPEYRRADPASIKREASLEYRRRRDREWYARNAEARRAYKNSWRAHKRWEAGGRVGPEPEIIRMK